MQGLVNPSVRIQSALFISEQVLIDLPKEKACARRSISMLSDSFWFLSRAADEYDAARPEIPGLALRS